MKKLNRMRKRRRPLAVDSRVTFDWDILAHHQGKTAPPIWSKKEGEGYVYSDELCAMLREAVAPYTRFRQFRDAPRYWREPNRAALDRIISLGRKYG